ncbi:MAG TPA: serine/threonine protein kinase, partial [Polyangiaceae bacterium]|nr:serine/threonine protein kinase [Polyangiaceae bacterium]
RLSGKRFAIKVLHHELVRQENLQARFEREAEAMSLLHHRNIVGVYDVDRTEDGRPFMVCEFLEGRELGDYLDEVGKLPLETAVSIGQQLCRALSVAHAAGVTHRDMKPENVFLVGDDPRRPSVKLLDFGLARLEGTDADSLTQAGTIMGTPSYMAPEQAKGSKVDGRADVYAVGAILYRALTGQRPYEREDARATLAAVLVEEPPRPRSIDPEISEEVEVIIQTAMAREPRDRYQSAEDLEDALAGLVGKRALATTPPLRSTQASAPIVVPPYSRMTLVVMMMLAVLWTVSMFISASVAVLELVIDRAAGESLGVSELAIVVGCVIAVLASPIALAVRHVRSAYWNNSLKVSRAVQGIRLVVLTSMAAYGAAALTVRVTDSVLARFVNVPSWPSSAAAWAGWPLALFLVGLVAAVASALSLRFSSDGTSRGRRILAGPVMATAATLVAGAIMYGSFVLRAGAVREVDVPAPLASASASASDEAPVAPTASAPASASVSASTSASAVSEEERASASELTKALAGGAPALEALSKRYPRDAAVLRALVELYAKDEEQHLLALDRASRLLEQQPDLASWSRLRVLALKAAQANEPISSRAFELMASRMGGEGAELLYDLMVAGNASARERAETLLGHDDVQKVASPEVRIAYELKKAKSCDAQLDLLQRAMTEGDGRAVAVLSYSIDGARKGCGPRRRSPCPARCRDEKYQGRMRAAIARIRQRVSGK